jgi:hypothetical protein
MQFHLNLKIEPFPFQIEHHQKIFLIGSCFAENISEWLKKRYFQVFSNPNGVLFNPQSIYICLKSILDNPNFFDEKFLFFEDGLWKSFLHQTYFYHTDKNEFVSNIIKSQQDAYEFLKSANYLFITFGSAFVYEHKELNQIVANCHKFPQSYFNRKILSVQEITSNFSALFHQLNKLNPKLKIILTVSPVKYLNYDAVNNNISKSTLILSVHQLCEQYKNVFYFPAYELVTDDLRDYRFYKEDMSHPNELAIQYILEKFSQSLLSSNAKQIVHELEKILSAIQHKIINKNSSKIKEFAINFIQQCERLESKYPYLKLNEEKNYFKDLLNEKITPLK